MKLDNYNLLKVIADDKTYVNFTSDSLINSVVTYYQRHNPRNDRYIRSLIYQGIVRTRMGVNDSTVFEPLKQADKLFERHTGQNSSIGYMIHYFLGNVHYNNNNCKLANSYFNDALNYAHEEKDSIHVFDTYLALYWNEMAQRNLEKAKDYLENLSSFYGKLSKKDFFILNAQSIYYDVQGEYREALKCEKKQLDIATIQKEDVNLSRLYYSISSRFNDLNQLDSAMFYAKLAINHINENDSKYNYLLYNNIANIAEKQHNPELANEYRKKTFEVYQQSVKERLNTQVIELEKKYDLTEAENVILRSQQGILLVTITTLILGMILITVIMINRRNRKQSNLKLLNAEYETQKQALKAELLTEEARKRAWLMLLYGYISDKLTLLQEQFEDLSQRYVTSHPKIYDAMDKILHETDTELHDMPKMLVPNDETFYYYTNIKDNTSFFNTNEKLLLMLLACKANNRQIATFMGTSMESIRARKSQLKKKMVDSGFEIGAYF